MLMPLINHGDTIPCLVCIVVYEPVSLPAIAECWLQRTDRKTDFPSAVYRAVPACHAWRLGHSFLDRMKMMQGYGVGGRREVQCIRAVPFNASRNKWIKISPMTGPPSVLYRVVPREPRTVLENHLNGDLWFRSHTWFRKRDDGDKLEGVGSYRGPDGIVSRDVSDDHPTQPAYFMSFSSEVVGARTHGREGHHVLRLCHPLRFQDEIRRNCLPTCGFVKLTWIKIEYVKTLDVADDPGPETWYRKYRCKPDRYADEREWRLQIQFMHSFRIQNDTLEFRWGQGIGKFFTMVPEQEQKRL